MEDVYEPDRATEDRVRYTKQVADETYTWDVLPAHLKTGASPTM
jgi:hypothetical protein